MAYSNKSLIMELPFQKQPGQRRKIRETGLDSLRGIQTSTVLEGV